MSLTGIGVVLCGWYSVYLVTYEEEAHRGAGNSESRDQDVPTRTEHSVT